MNALTLFQALEAIQDHRTKKGPSLSAADDPDHRARRHAVGRQ
jgi:hypothetical protein